MAEQKFITDVLNMDIAPKLTRPTARKPHHVFRDATRRTPCNLSALCIQANVSRDQLAALLHGADHCTLRTLHNVADRLGLVIRIELPAQSTSHQRTTATPSVVDLALRRFADQ